MKKKYIALVTALGILIGWLTLGGSSAVMHYTSSTEFCISCHTMTTAYEEYQGSVHFTNAKGIRAECSDCHIPKEPLDYLYTKIRATKDIYHQYITGKIDTPEKYLANKAAMAEDVWSHLRANDSATCRSCHTFSAMETYAQSRDAQKMHQYAIENNQTCIDCHKGVAHLAPEMKLDNKAYETLLSFTAKTAADASVVYPISNIAISDLGTINPTAKLEVQDTQDNKRTVVLNAFQMKGAEQVLYFGQGQRAIVATLNEKGQKALTAGEYIADEYGNEWRAVSLTGSIDSPVVDSLDPVWSYAEQLDNVYCATCHAKIPAKHFTVNAWGPVAKSMGDRTDISAANLELLTKFFQYHARDVVGK